MRQHLAGGDAKAAATLYRDAIAVLADHPGSVDAFALHWLGVQSLTKLGDRAGADSARARAVDALRGMRGELSPDLRASFDATAEVHADLVGQLRALGNPMIHALDVELDALFVALRDRVVETHALQRTAIALVAMIGDDDVVEGTLFGAATGQANLDHLLFALKFWVRPAASAAGKPLMITACAD